MSNDNSSLRTLLAEALEIRDLQERANFLSRSCGNDADLRRELEELIEADTMAGSFLPDKPVADGCVSVLSTDEMALSGGGPRYSAAITERLGDFIGRYKLLQKIGEGGCGIVYMAEQEEPVRRKLALKVIKLGMDTKSVVARFEAERQALALMDHPNIARVLDAGATETGRPFFVMELVRGIKITDYCNQENLSVQQRLKLFILVCQAVQHAHQKGIIHRDLKPSNILVTVNDGIPVPKVIDFGIAKATGGRLTDSTLFTAFDQFIGTPAYMSPEQAVMTSLDIDTRSDIYSLGVLLYEVLTGKTPFDTQALLASGLDELRRTICEREPLRPSTRLTMELTGSARQHATWRANEKTLVAGWRNSQIQERLKFVRGDPDWIVMKCLEKDRARRYATANELAMDIQRHLDCEPVIARPPSRLYEFQKTVRRHKGGFATATAILLALAAGGVVSNLQAIRARRAEQEQSRLRLAATENEHEAEKQARRARIAEADAKEKLWASYLAQARAGRWSRRAGRRFEGLELLKKAAAMRPSLELRNEAIACMALADLHEVKQWRPCDFDTTLGFDGRYERYAFADGHGNVRVCRVEDEKELCIFHGYELPVRALELSSDGRFLLVASGKDGSQVEVRDLDRVELVLRLVEPQFREGAFSQDGKFLAIAFEDKQLDWPIRIFDLSSKKEISSFGHHSLPYHIRFNPAHSNQLLTSDWSPTVKVWDWQTGQVVQRLEHRDPVWGIAWDPNGETIATGCTDNQIYLWDATAAKLRGGLTGHSAVPRQLCFNADGEFLISGDWDGVLHLWDPKEQREMLSMPAPAILPFSSSSDRFAVGLGGGRMAIVEAASRGFYRALHSRLAPEEGCLSCDFSPKKGFLLCSDLNGMRLWDLASWNEIGIVAEEEHAKHFAFFHPDGTSVFINASNGVQNWSADMPETNGPTFKLRRTIGSGQRYGQLALSADGATLAAPKSDSVLFFSVSTGAQVCWLKTAYSEPMAALSPDGQTAATWGPLSRTVQLWDLSNSNLLHELPSSDVSIHVLFSPNRRWIVVGDGAEYRVWDRQTWQTLYVLPRTAASTWARMAFSPDCTLLAVAITRSTVQLFEAATGRELATLEAPQRMNIGWIAFSPGGTDLAVTTAPGLIQLWDLRRIRRQLASMNLDWDSPPYP